MLNDELLHKWVEGTLTTEELEQFKLRPEYDSLKSIKEQTEHFAAPDFDEEAMLSNILKQKKDVSKKSGGRRILLSTWAKYSVAAALLLLAGWFFFPKENTTTYTTVAGQIVDGILPDGSTFNLNAGSELSFLKKSWKEDRTLNLDGEAFFDVKQGSTFRVETSNGSVQVLGTQFNVRSRGNTIEVTCRSGKVAVISKEGKVIRELSPSHVVRVVNNKIDQFWVIGKEAETGWQDGIFKFRKVPLSTVLEELERQFEIKINSQGINVEEIINCNFQNEDLELALKTSLSQLEIEYEIKNSKTVILKK